MLFLAALTMARFLVLMIGAAIYDVRDHLGNREMRAVTFPTVTILIPAYNEANTIARSLASAAEVAYDTKKLSVYVIDDGSTDETATIVKALITRNRWEHVHLLQKPNSGKAESLNIALDSYVKSDLVMCLDADSTLRRNALMRAVRYFQDTRTVALVANIKIRPDGRLLNLIQEYEYVIGWQIKRALAAFNIEYIIGGIGSMFRTDTLRAIGGYDTDTLVEDMDLTFKILRLGMKEHRIAFGWDVICDTEGVLTFGALLKQRYRWKFGHMQTLLKHRDLFFSRDPKHAKQFTWFYLPFVVITEAVVLLEPGVPLFLLVLIVAFGDSMSFLMGLASVSIATSLQILAETGVPLRQRLRLIASAPAMYIGMIILSTVWAISLARSYANIRSLRDTTSHWQPVERARAADA